MVTIFKLGFSETFSVKFTHLLTGLIKTAETKRKKSARFFLKMIQKMQHPTLKIIRTGKARESKLNQAKVFGGTTSFSKVPKRRTITKRCMRTKKNFRIFTNVLFN